MSTAKDRPSEQIKRFKNFRDINEFEVVLREDMYRSTFPLNNMMDRAHKTNTTTTLELSQYFYQTQYWRVFVRTGAAFIHLMNNEQKR